MNEHGNQTQSQPPINFSDFSGGKFLKAADLDPGEEKTLTIAWIGAETVDSDFGQVQKLICRFEGLAKSLILNTTNINALRQITNSNDATSAVGISVTLFAEPVVFGGKKVMGLRLKPADSDAPF